MSKAKTRATFEFDDSVLVENRRLHIPLSISRSESSSSHLLKTELLNLCDLNLNTIANSRVVRNKFDVNEDLNKFMINNSSQSSNRDNLQSRNRDNLLNKNNRDTNELINGWLDRNREACRRVYQVLLDETLSELRRIDSEQEALKKASKPTSLTGDNSASAVKSDDNKLPNDSLNESGKLEPDKLPQDNASLFGSLQTHNLNASTPFTLKPENSQSLFKSDGGGLLFDNSKSLAETKDASTLMAESGDNKLLVDSNLENNNFTINTEDTNWILKLASLNGADLGSFDFVPRESRSLKLFGEFRQSFAKVENTVNAIANDISQKQARVEILKSLTKCVNSLANTRRQIGLVLNSVTGLINQFNRPDLTLYILFKLVEKVINCCEEGNQIYISQHSAWTYAKLLFYLSNTYNNINSSNPNNNFNNVNNLNNFNNVNNNNVNNVNKDKDNLVYVILVNLLLNRCSLVVPVFYTLSDNNTPNNNNNNNNSNSNAFGSSIFGSGVNVSGSDRLREVYFGNSSSGDDVKFGKRVSGYLALYFSFLTLRNDFGALWHYYSNFANCAWANVFLPVLPVVGVTLLRTTAHFMLSVFKSQFLKVLENIRGMVESRLSAESSLGGCANMYLGQLQQFYALFKSSGKLDEPEGYATKPREEELRDDV